MFTIMFVRPLRRCESGGRQLVCCLVVAGVHSDSGLFLLLLSFKFIQKPDSMLQQEANLD